MKKDMKVALWAQNMASDRPWIKSLEQAVGDAGRAGADFFMAPEYSCMAMLSRAPEMPETSELAWLAANTWMLDCDMIRLARHSKVDVLAGTIPWRWGGRILNQATAILTDETGPIFWTQPKNHLTREEQDPLGWTASPGEQLRLHVSKGVRMAIAVCHDVTVDGYAARVRVLAPDIVFVPSMTETGSGRDSHEEIFGAARKRSREWNCAVCCVGAVGVQELPSRKETNVGGAAVYVRGEAIFDTGAMEATEDHLGPVHVVEVAL